MTTRYGRTKWEYRLFSKSEVNLIDFDQSFFAKILTKATTLKALREEKSCWSAGRARTRASFLTWLGSALSPSLRSLVGFYARASKSASAQSGNPRAARAGGCWVRAALLGVQSVLSSSEEVIFLSNRGRSLYPLLARKLWRWISETPGAEIRKVCNFWLVWRGFSVIYRWVFPRMFGFFLWK